MQRWGGSKQESKQLAKTEPDDKTRSSKKREEGKYKGENEGDLRSTRRDNLPLGKKSWRKNGDNKDQSGG